MTAYMPASATVEWSTPQDLFDQLNAEFHFTLDVCATDTNAKCDKYFTLADNGLLQPWAPHVCWMNPPYGRVLRDWMAKAVAEAKAGATVVCLVPVRSDTAWWHDYAMHGQIRYLRGRLKFGGCKSAAPFPSAIVVFSPCPA